MSNNVKLEATTTQSHHIKQFFSSLKEQITDTELECNSEGIRILSIDTAHVVCVQAELYASKFEHYECPVPFTFGIDIMAVNKILKYIVNGDILTLFVESDENSCDVLGIKVKNDSKAEDSVFFIDQIETNNNRFRQDDLNYTVSIMLPSTDLQSIINRLKNTGSDVIQILYKQQSLTFIAKGDTAKAVLNRRKSDNNNAGGINILTDNSDGLITIFLNIYKVFEFTKCTNLSQYVTCYLEADSPVYFEYQIGSLGRIRLGISPRTIPDNWRI